MTTTRMHNFKRMVDILGQGEKLLTTSDKLTMMSINPDTRFETEKSGIYKKVALVLKPKKRLLI